MTILLDALRPKGILWFLLILFLIIGCNEADHNQETLPSTLAPPQLDSPPSVAVVIEAYDYLYGMMDLYDIGDQLRLIDSYTDHFDDKSDTAWVYDNSLVILALLARGDAEDLSRAQILGDALIYAQENDPEYEDGRIRDAYHARQFINTDGSVSIAAPGSATGNMAWAGLALLALWEETEEPRYFFAAEKLAHWIAENTYDDRGSDGYAGGMDDEGRPYFWISTEHNADAFALFNRFHAHTGDPLWHERALHARTFLNGMWNSDKGFFLDGNNCRWHNN